MTGRAPYAWSASVAVIVTALVMPALGEDNLRVCLNENIPIYSVRKGTEAFGFDVKVAEAVARKLNRRLVIQWFETKLEADSSLTIDANTLLSDGRCDLVGGYPLIKGSLGKPRVAVAKMADFAGAKAVDRRRRVALGELVSTYPYHRAALTVIVNGTAVAKPVTELADLKGLRIAIEASTLGDAILMTYRDGLLVNDITHLTPERGDLLGRLEAGEFDATLVNLRRFDAYRAEHPTARLEAKGFYHRIGFNMGFVGLASQAPLIEEVNKAISTLMEQGELQKLAVTSGLTFVPPRDPPIGENVTLSDLREK